MVPDGPAVKARSGSLSPLLKVRRLPRTPGDRAGAVVRIPEYQRMAGVSVDRGLAGIVVGETVLSNPPTHYRETMAKTLTEKSHTKWYLIARVSTQPRPRPASNGALH